MPYLDVYATADQYMTRYFQQAPHEATAIDADLAAASRTIDRDAGWSFGRDDNPTIRVYRCDDFKPEYIADKHFVYIDPIASESGTTVHEDTAMDGTFATQVDASKFRLMDDNAMSSDVPFTKLQLTYNPRHDIRVNAIHGWPSIPAPITLLAMLRTAATRAEGPIATGEINGLPITGTVYDEIGRLLNGYRREDFLVEV